MVDPDASAFSQRGLNPEMNSRRQISTAAAWTGTNFKRFVSEKDHGSQKTETCVD
jgi:hypothetical protein